MKKLLTLSLGTLLLAGTFLTGCGNNEYTITICASEVPHKRILDEVVKDILKEDGYKLKTTALDWTLQNDAVAHGEYDANFFQHIPYLETYQGEEKLVAVAKVHYERLCGYASDLNHKTLQNGDSIEIVNDISNIERALNLLVEEGVLTINSSCYDETEAFKTFDITNPKNSITFTQEFNNCELVCIKESLLCASLPDYDFGIIPGNTALTGLNNFQERISFGEDDEKLISERANVIAVKEENKNSPKTKALVKALSNEKVQSYIQSTFGNSVLYYYEDLLA